MSYNNFTQALELITLNSNHCRFIVPQSEFNINELEKILNLRLPNSYKHFLKRFGSLDIGNQDIFGLTNNNDFHIYI